MTRQVLFTPQRATEDDVLANASPGATAEFFITGTTTPIAIEDVDGNALSNPLSANSVGVFPQVVYLGPDQVKCVIKDADGGTLYTIDPCPLFDAAGASAVTVSYAPNAFLPQINVQDALDQIAGILQGAGGAVFFDDGSATDPSIAFASDTDTGFYRAGANDIGIATGGAVRARFSDTGLRMAINGTSSLPAISFRTGSDNAGLYSPGGQVLGFVVAQSERGRVSGANFFWGQTTTSAPGDGNTTNGFAIQGSGTTYIAANNAAALSINRNGGDGTAVAFHRQDARTAVGSIGVTASATSYNTSSDVRLKTNVAPSEDPGETIDAIGIVQFDWIAGDHQRWGVIAQDLHQIAPEAVTVGDDGEEITEAWAWDASKLVPMMVKEIQLLRQRVAELEAK
jgi:hypothetical protein